MLDTDLFNEVEGTFYDLRTPAKVVMALESARKHGFTIRLFMGDRETGESWSEENDVSGRVSRSFGPRKVPILLNNRNSRGGPAILDHCIVGIIFRDRYNSIQWLYRHPKLYLGDWTAHSEDAHTGERAEARRDGEVHARFDKFEQAVRYCKFMKSERLRK